MDRGDHSKANDESATGPLAYRVLVAIGVAVLIVGILGLVGYAIHIFLVAFAAVLFGLFLSTPAVWLERHARMSYRWALGVVVLSLTSLTIVTASVIGLTLWEQVQELSRALPTSLAEARLRLEETQWGRWLLDNVDQQEQPRDEEAPDDRPGQAEPGQRDGRENGQQPREGGPTFGGLGIETMLTGVGGAAFQMMHFVAALVVILFAGFYFAAEPDWYRRGLVLLVPPPKRDRAEQVLDELRYTLRWWIVGQLAAMIFVGLVWGTGLWLLGVRLALVLALLAFVAELIPFLGPVLASIPAFLLAATQPEVNLLYVLFLYLGLQTIEAYVVIPLFQERAVRLPPAITILAVMLLAYLGGLLGALLAAPLTIATITLVRKLYVEDVLGSEEADAS